MNHNQFGSKVHHAVKTWYFPHSVESIINEETLQNFPLKQSLSTMSNMDHQLLHQKSHQKFSVMKTKISGVSRKTVYFGILIHVLS